MAQSVERRIGSAEVPGPIPGASFLQEMRLETVSSPFACSTSGADTHEQQPLEVYFRSGSCSRVSIARQRDMSRTRSVCEWAPRLCFAQNKDDSVRGACSPENESVRVSIARQRDMSRTRSVREWAPRLCSAFVHLNEKKSVRQSLSFHSGKEQEIYGVQKKSKK